jgi:hypothetical protein
MDFNANADNLSLKCSICRHPQRDTEYQVEIIKNFHRKKPEQQLSPSRHIVNYKMQPFHTSRSFKGIDSNGTTSLGRVEETNIMMFARDDDDDDSLQDINDQSSLGSMFNASFSSFRSMVDNAMVNLRDNVESEIVLPPTVDEIFRDNAVKTEKDARIRNIMIGDEEFRQFKKSMHDNGVVTTNAINQSISRSIGKRVSMDVASQQTRRPASLGAGHQNLRSTGMSNRQLGA